jgi:hypothetical protein
MRVVLFHYLSTKRQQPVDLRPAPFPARHVADLVALFDNSARDNRPPAWSPPFGMVFDVAGSDAEG